MTHEFGNGLEGYLAEYKVETSKLFAGMESELSIIDAMEASVAADKTGLENDSVSTQDVIMSQHTLATSLLLSGYEYEVLQPCMESIVNDPASELYAGMEAKENIIKKIIRKAKEFLRYITRSIKTLQTKAIGYFLNYEKKILTLTKSIRSLDVDEDIIILSDKSEEALVKHKEVLYKLGVFSSHGVIDGFRNLVESYEDLITERFVFSSTASSVVKDMRFDYSKEIKANGAIIGVLDSKPVDDILTELGKINKGALGVYISNIVSPRHSYISACYYKNEGDYKRDMLFAKRVDTLLPNTPVPDGDVTISHIKNMSADFEQAVFKYQLKDITKHVSDVYKALDKHITTLERNTASQSAIKGTVKIMKVYNASVIDALTAVLSYQRTGFFTLNTLYSMIQTNTKAN